MLNVEPPAVYDNQIQWGVHHKLKMTFGTSTVYSCLQIEKDEFIAITSNGLIRYKNNVIKEKSKIILSTATFIKENYVIVGVISTTTQFVFLRPNDLAHPIFTQTKTKQIPTFHIIYSQNSNVLITAGKNIKIWNLKCQLPSRNIISIPPVIDISFRSEIEDTFDIDLINNPIFNYKNEYIILPKSTGFNAYDIDGKFVKQMTKLPTPKRTAGAYWTETNCFITVDPHEGACEWNYNGALLKRTTIGSSTVFACRFINNSFVLYLDSKNCIYIYDVKSFRLFSSLELNDKPMSMEIFFFNKYPSLVVCIESSIDVYDIIIPWELWAPNLVKPKSIHWYPRKNKAARIVAHTDNEYLYFISPKTALTVTSFCPSSPMPLFNFCYDRGLYTNIQRDQLLVVLNDGRLVISSMGTKPCEEIIDFDLHAISVFVGNFENTTCYYVITSSGEILINDYDSFELIKRVFVTTGKVLTAKFDYKNETIILFYEYEVIRYDISNSKIVSNIPLNHQNQSQIPFQPGSIFEMEDQIALIGYKSGKIDIIYLDDVTMKKISNDESIFHTDEVTGFSFGKNFFISVSKDQQMKFWSFSGRNFMTIIFPLPLYSVAVFNGKRDIIVGTDKELMIVKGSSIFSSPFEQKDMILDNYNEKDDFLTNDGDSPLKQLLEQKQAYLISRKEDNENDNNFSNQRPIVSFQSKKKMLDEETRRKIYEKMMKMTEGSFDAKRIAEREKRLFEQQKKEIESKANKANALKAAANAALQKEEELKKEQERNEKQKQRMELIEEGKKIRELKLDELKKFKEDLQKRNEEQKIEQEKQKKIEKEKEEERRKNEEMERKRKEESDEIKFPKEDFDLGQVEGSSNQNLSPRKKNRKKNKHKKTQKISDSMGLIKIGKNQFIDKNGEVFKIDENGNIIPLDKKLPSTFVAPDGTVYTRQENGQYISADGDILKGPLDDSTGGYFMTDDGTKPGDTYIDENGNLFTKTFDGWVDQNGKHFHLGKDGKYIADDGTVWDGPNDSQGAIIRGDDGFSGNNVYIDSNGHAFKRTPSNRGWIDKDGNTYHLNKDGQYVNDKDPNSIMPLSEEKLCWITKDGLTFRPTGQDNEWISSDGRKFKLINNQFVSEDGTAINGPSAHTGVYVGRDVSSCQFLQNVLQWVDHDGVVYKCTSRDGKSWVNSLGQVYIRQSDGTYIEEGSYDKNTNKDVWNGPGKTGTGNWVNGKGHIIDSLDGFWVSPDKKIYTATKLGYISSDAILYKPTNNSNSFLAYGGEKWTDLGKPGCGKWVEANGNEYEPLDINGNWRGYDGQIYSPHPQGYWVAPNGSVWKGPPFISSKEYFNQKLRNGVGLYFTPRQNRIRSNYEVMIGKPRSSTPLYKIPPLLYPPYKSKYKPFRPKTPPPKRLRVIYTIPPPNIVVDRSQVVKLILAGNSQLIPLIDRLGLNIDRKSITPNLMSQKPILNDQSSNNCSALHLPEKPKTGINPRSFNYLTSQSYHIKKENINQEKVYETEKPNETQPEIAKINENPIDQYNQTNLIHGRNQISPTYSKFKKAPPLYQEPVSPIPIMSFVQRNFSSAPKTARDSDRFYSSRGIEFQKRKSESKDLSNPLIVRSMTRPKLIIPQSLTRPKRNF